MNIKDYIDQYVQNNKEHDTERDKIGKRITQRKAQIVRLENKLEKLWGKMPNWIDSIIKPIAEKMIKRFPDRYYDILGPFGIGARTSIHFYKKGVQEKKQFEGDNCISITFEPMSLKTGEICVVDYTKDTRSYNKGSLGEANGLNHPTIPMETDIDWLIDWMKRKRRR